MEMGMGMDRDVVVVPYVICKILKSGKDDVNIMNMNTLPLVEKYRPTEFDDIVLDDMTKLILNRMIDTKTIPNILLYGPPGTGKTTTAINLIKAYQSRWGSSNNSVIHLNASDDRGIDVIRTHLYNFVSSRSMFESGIKFIILDEADYMTKPAQSALRSIIHTYSETVRICFICNYISKIEEGLLSEFVVFRFNAMPSCKILELLRKIIRLENIELSEKMLDSIRSLYGSDIRSMINCIHTHLHTPAYISIVTPEFLETIYKAFAEKYPIPHIINLFLTTSHDVKFVVKTWFNDMVRNRPDLLNDSVLQIISASMHFLNCPLPVFVGYVVTQLYNKI